MSIRKKWRRGPRSTQRASSHSPAHFQWEYDPSGDVDPALYALQAPDASTVQDTPARLPSAPKSEPYLTNSSSVADNRTNEALSTTSLPAPAIAGGMQVDPQTAFVRHNLDTALMQWRTSGECASIDLTNAGLDCLSQGNYLPPDQRALLLRSALRQRQRMLTALRCQEDEERVAIILSEELTAPVRGVTPETVLQLRERDTGSESWYWPLLRELGFVATSSDVRVRRHAVDALWRLQGSLPPDQTVDGASGGSRLWPAIAITVVALLVIGSVLSASIAFGASANLTYVPPGTYTLFGVDNEQYKLSTDGFYADRFEVTNEWYKRCVAREECSHPAMDVSVSTDENYANSEYDSYPVVGVTLAQAEQFCQTYGMRLPTADEWSLIAGATPATTMPLDFPWGNGYAVQRANMLEAQLHGPVAVGSYSPAGDSPIGASDVAGNVAEWTFTTPDSGTTYIVKGGSFRDNANHALVSAAQMVTPDGYAEWIGFRCIHTGNSKFPAPFWRFSRR